MEPKSVVLDYVERCGRGDFDGVAGLLAPDVEYAGPGNATKGADAYLAVLRRIGAVWRGSELKRAFADGGDVCVIYDFVTQTGARVPIVEWAAVRDGRIASVRLFFDRATFTAGTSRP